MKINAKDFLETGKFIEHALLGAIGRAGLETKVCEVRDEEENVIVDVEMKISGVVVDIKDVFQFFEDAFYSEVEDRAGKVQNNVAQFEKWKANYISKHSDNAKLQKVKENQEKILQMIDANNYLIKDIVSDAKH